MDVRKIGLLVEQPFDGSYYWVIHEDVRHDGHFEPLHRAAHLDEGLRTVAEQAGHRHAVDVARRRELVGIEVGVGVEP